MLVKTCTKYIDRDDEKTRVMLLEVKKCILKYGKRKSVKSIHGSGYIAVIFFYKVAPYYWLLILFNKPATT